MHMAVIHVLFYFYWYTSEAYQAKKKSPKNIFLWPQMIHPPLIPFDVLQTTAETPYWLEKMHSNQLLLVMRMGSKNILSSSRLSSKITFMAWKGMDSLFTVLCFPGSMTRDNSRTPSLCQSQLLMYDLWDCIKTMLRFLSIDLGISLGSGLRNVVNKQGAEKRTG